VPLRDGPVRVAEAPPAPAPAPVRSAAAPAEAAAPAAQTRRVRSDGRVPTTLTAAAGPVVVPEGYERVWDDGRLNPDRARGTLAGVQAMELMWTSTVPRRLIHRPTGRDMTAAFLAAAGAGAPEAAAVRVSTRGGDAAGKGETLVQAAAFRDAGNAASAAARLRAAGIAAEMRPADGFTLVLAGPFESRAAARAALPAVRRAGFGDAFLR
ncbi:MAG: SPOR domain-containing protein, partial [Rhodobacteraceae bacterium]|nr:SPOR domain-containing protein [Paracoccaceae bacterium]